ncbi:NmrA-domain-containing protein [Trichoderma citrinoviride]|uniref:NmrA-domain-containing protein n=1 Tax=Trichoderma citrinoviride TaxID=58853 RepID=A0A2T4B955_9HYPO|nr:NmrA-domain-containing protein [Trichoderma citrinoviride]PTB65854.1 NmrA-domain-containing protein [Trichoderma citrinoviride]
MSKIITVFGATGNQGGSVVEAILTDKTLSREFKIRGITRDVNKPAAQKLASKGVELVVIEYPNILVSQLKADMSSSSSVAPAVKDAHTVFLVTNFWESMSADVEIAQGKAVVDASKAAGVEHIVFSSLIDVTKASNGRLPNISHFDGKARIEEYIRASGVAGTYVLPGMFMSGFTTMIRPNPPSEPAGYTLALPVDPNKAKAPLFAAAEDMGKFVKAAIKNFPTQAGSRILAATDYYTIHRLISEFSEVMGKPAQAVQIPDDKFKSFLSPVAAQELLENMKLLEDPGYYAGESLGASLALLEEKPTTWKEFVEKHKEKWLHSSPSVTG